jgi:hypothetical protein
MKSIITDALDIRRKHLAVGKPMHFGRGFKEMNIAFSVSLALQQAGYYAFPEFHYKGGSIDAIFVRGDEVIVCEWKYLSHRSVGSVVAQTKRMLSFKPEGHLPDFGFKSRKWKTRYLWVADSWEKRAVDWWLGAPSTIRDKRPFNDKWHVGSEAFSLGPEFDPYYVWVWAYT